tara:strand:- start:9 stop:794 length:786 start_codon:yes stop_codon:yes gene_type:complete
MLETIKEIKYAFKTRRAWWFTASARTRARYSRTILGSYWIGLSTIFTTLILGSIYRIIFNINDLKEYLIFLGIGLLIWNSLSNSINAASRLFDNNIDNLRNRNLKPLFYILESWAFELQNFFQALLIVLIGFGITSPSIISNTIIYAPINILNLLLFIFWLPLFICLIGIKYCDLFQFIPIFTQILFLVSPILYPEKNLDKYQILAQFNPIYQVLKILRESIIDGKFFFYESVLVLLINLVMIILALKLLRQKEKSLIFYL